MGGRRILGLVAALLLAALPLVASGQEAPAAAEPAAEPAAPKPYPLAEVALRAEETRKQVQSMQKRLEPSAEVLAVDELLATEAMLVENSAHEAQERLAGKTLTGKSLSDLENKWLARRKQIAAWHKLVTQRGTAVDKEVAALDEFQTRWKATQQAATEGDTTPALEWIEQALADVAKGRESAAERTRALVGLQGRLASVDRMVSDVLDGVGKAEEQRRRSLFEPDTAPLWSYRPEGDLAAAMERVRTDWSDDGEALFAFLETRRERLFQQGLLVLATLFFVVMLGRRVGRQEAVDQELGEAVVAFRYPISVALLVGVLTASWFYPLAPSAWRDVLGLVLLIPALTLLPPLVGPTLRPVIYALAGFYLASQVRATLDAAPALARYVFTLEATAALVFLVWLMRPVRLAKIEDPAQIPKFAAPASRLTILVVAAAFVANLLGYYRFATILGEGLLWTFYGAAILYGGYRIARSLVAVTLGTATARRLRMVRVGAADIERWIGRVLAVGALVWWASISLRAFAVEVPALAALQAVFDASASVGSVTISLADVLLFVAVIAASFLISRFVRFVLQEDIFPRVVLRRGVSNAISTTVNYTILMAGLLFALAAAGFELGKLTLLAGAFGVGIGFGLQNVVNNFVSGLILLFERPIQVGDTIEVGGGGLLGEVRRIGPRSSTVRTFDGAEVIVPNGMLVSDQVINWTLSDRRRRIIVAVGVAYGSDPTQVIEILDAVAKENETVLEEPAPFAVFVGFGDSSLDFELRCWIPRYEEGFGMRSALWIALYQKLNEAGIEIPFPQRDLHLRSVDQPAERVLGDLAGRGEPEAAGPSGVRRLEEAAPMAGAAPGTRSGSSGGSGQA